MYIDTHCHLSCDDYDDVEEVIVQNRKSDISKIIISGCTKESIMESLEIAEKYEDVFVTIGFHPSEANVVSDSDLAMLEEHLGDTKVVGIGEIGLDYHYGTGDKEIQKMLFHKQLKLAEKYNLPVVIHSRDATMDTIEILKQYKVVGDVHCFSGSVETAKIYIQMGFYLGIGGVVTFKNSKLINVIKEIGISHILLETDSPYLTPEPFRGKKNSSKYIPYVAEFISKNLDIDILDVAKITTSNAVNLFDL